MRLRAPGRARVIVTRLTRMTPITGQTPGLHEPWALDGAGLGTHTGLCTFSTMLMFSFGIAFGQIV